MDFKKRLSLKPKKIPKFRRVDKYIFADSVILDAGKNPEDFEETHAPTEHDLKMSMERIKFLEGK